MKTVYIIGIGIGDTSFICEKSLNIIKNSDCLIGAKRMLENFIKLNKETYQCINYQEIYSYIKSNDSFEIFSVLVSGDTGFFSISKKLTNILLNDNNINVQNIPGLSSMQYFCSKLNISWSNVKFLSVHGRNQNIVSPIIFNKYTFMLTGGEMTVDKICELLESKGLGNLKIFIGENLSYYNERIVEDNIKNIVNKKCTFENLSVVIVFNEKVIDINDGLRSINDDEFITGQVPMTKSEVRTVSIGKLRLKKNYVLYDIGAGTGSISIESAFKLTEGMVYSIEKNKDAIKLIKENIEKFGTYNVEVVEGEAPYAIELLEIADAAFIGGSSGNMDEIIASLLKKNPLISIVINAITLQTLNESIACMENYKFKNIEITHISVSKSKKVGRYNMMMGQNPIYVISGKGCGSYDRKCNES